jgi:hypothetical protein
MVGQGQAGLPRDDPVRACSGSGSPLFRVSAGPHPIRQQGGFSTINREDATTAWGRVVPTADVGYPVAQLRGQLFDREVARTDVAGRPITDIRDMRDDKVGRASPRGGKPQGACRRSAVAALAYRVGTVPPSIRYSAPVIEADRGDAKKTIKSATSRGLAGRPTGIPPSQSMTIFLPPS